MYLQARRCRRTIWAATSYSAAALLLLLGMASREIACIWAAIFVVHLLFFERGNSRWRRLAVVVGCVAVVSAYAGLRSLPEPRELEPIKSGWDGVTRTGLVLRALGDYARVTLVPTNLHMERSVTDPRMMNPTSLADRFSFTYLTLLGLLTAAALIAGGFVKGNGRALRIFGALWFVFGFLPISNIFELNATAAEHWLYLPMAGLLLVLLGWALELPARWFRVTGFAALLFAAVLAGRSTVRSGDWVTPQVFYERTIAASGWSPRVGLNLGIIYSSQGRLAEARQLLERTLACWPDYPLARNHLAAVVAKEGATETSERLLVENASRAATQQFEYPRTWAAAVQLARYEMKNGRDDAALRVLAETRSRLPNVWRVAELQAEIIRRTVGPDAALPIVQHFTDQCWWDYSAFLALGKLKAQQGDGVGALVALRHASRLDIRETEALNLMTRIQLNIGNLEAALGAQRRAVSRQPDEPSQHVLYSEVLSKMGRTQQAARALERARLLRESGGSSA
jgi:tetratricopeptide (TPR) repeat protein